MAVLDWTTVVGTSAALIGMAGAGVGVAKWWHRSIVDGVAERMAPVRREFEPNGGTSIKDQVTRTAQELHDHKSATEHQLEDIKRMIRDLGQRVDRLYTRRRHEDTQDGD